MLTACHKTSLKIPAEWIYEGWKLPT